MATYIINGNSSTPTYPYNNSTVGAVNFTSLLEDDKVVISDGDTFKIYNPRPEHDSVYDIDESGNSTMEIHNRLTITSKYPGHTNPKIICPADPMFTLSADSLRSSNGTKISNIDFDGNASGAPPISIHNETSNIEISNCGFYPGSIHSDDTLHSNIIVHDNYFDSTDEINGNSLLVINKGTGIKFYNNTIVGNNMIGGVGVTDTSNVDIYNNTAKDVAQFVRLDGYAKGVDIHSNLITMSASSGPAFDIGPTETTIDYNTINLYNNIVEVPEEYVASVIHTIPTLDGGLSPSDSVSEFNIYNNIIYNLGGDISTNAAFSVGFNNGIFDWNNIYGFVHDVSFSSGYSVSANGRPHTLNVDPKVKMDSVGTLPTLYWFYPTFQNNYTNIAIDDDYVRTAYNKDDIFVYLRGRVVGGTGGTDSLIFTLPVGYRPITDYIHNDGAGDVVVHTDGRVTGELSTATLDGIVFPYSETAYCLDKTSECRNTGRFGEDMGVCLSDKYVTFTDSVTKDLGSINRNNSNISVGIRGTVLSESSTAINSYYTRGYPTNTHQNQFDFVYDGIFPFTEESPFYKKDINYVIKHRDDLSPFSNIYCPANPGYEFSADYPEYETGIFGNSRKVYEHYCGLTEECTIYDTFNSTSTIIRNAIDITGDDYEIQNAINPECGD